MQQEVILGIYGSHNSAITLAINNEIKEVIEIERFLNSKNASLFYYPPTLVDDVDDVLNRVSLYIKNKYNIDRYDIVYHDMIDVERTKKYFPSNSYVHTQHHVNHANSSLYQSTHEECLTISFDGGGNDGWFIIFKHTRGSPPVVLHNENVNYGVCYSMISHYIREVKHEDDYLKGNLVYAGKIMGLAGYGNIRDEWIEEFDNWYKLPTGVDHEGLAKEMLIRMGVSLDDGGLASSTDSRDLAATNQLALERNVIRIAKPYLDQYPDLPVHITGGGGLNILLNTKLSKTRETFVAPNPSDCGLTVGMVSGHIKPDSSHPVDITYAGPEVFDSSRLQEFTKNRKTRSSFTLTALVNDLSAGKIVGVVRNGCEHGPRALGNRSILCNPCYPEMKDTLNAKVKHREWYRPFAPVVRLEDVSKYFEWNKESRWMNYCPKVKDEYKDILTSITHVDGTARVQTVTREENEWLYDLLTAFEAETGNGVLLNTSFNVDGKPILNTYEDAFEVLDNTQMDSLYLNGTYIEKNLEMKENNSNLTIVSGLWDINRPGRNFNDYIDKFKEFLQINQNMVLFLPEELHEIVWSIRSADNTVIHKCELQDIRELYDPFWQNTQTIRQSEQWLNQAGWLPGSPQAVSEWYNPIVMSKYSLLHTAVCYDNFNTDYYMWLDAGITFTCSNGFLGESFFDSITNTMDPFLFLSYPYQAENEIHGFEYSQMNRYAREEVKYVCRGGLFGGHKDYIVSGNHTYWHLVNDTLNQGLMGTEESIFTLMSHLEPWIYKRYSLDSNGLIVKFVNELSTNKKITHEPVRVKTIAPKPIVNDISNINTSLYFLTFNFPEQLETTIKTLQNHEDFLTHPRNKYVIDNSTNEQAMAGNKLICDKYGFVHLPQEKNTGICGGRQFAAEHFDKGEDDFYLFFEDDMTISDPEEGICRNGFQKYIPKLYLKLHQIMLKENLDFLKLSYTEVYMDNNIQVSWYNVPQDIRSKIWPDYDRLPVNGLDPNSPRTEFGKIEVLNGLSYITGDIYYANWPHITSREGNKKMFINTTWANPYEQTWMSHIFQESIKGNIKPAVLLASPVTHERFKHYRPEERIES